MIIVDDHMSQWNSMEAQEDRIDVKSWNTQAQPIKITLLLLIENTIMQTYL